MSNYVHEDKVKMDRDTIKSIRQKRLINEIKLMHDSPIEGMNVYIDNDDVSIWYCLIIGHPGTSYEGGEYIAKIIIDNDYPMTAPKYYMHTPNGRYEIDTNILLYNSKYQNWVPTWNLQVMIRSWLSNMLDEESVSGIGHIKKNAKSDVERRQLATSSIEWNQKHYPDLYKKLKDEYIKCK